MAGEGRDRAKLKQCLECVIKDMGPNLLNENLPKNLRFEEYGILYWYEKACDHLQEIEPRPRLLLNRERIQHRYEGVTFERVGPAMFGPIAQTYLSRPEYRKHVLREIRLAQHSGVDNDLATVC